MYMFYSRVRATKVMVDGNTGISQGSKSCPGDVSQERRPVTLCVSVSEGRSWVLQESRRKYGTRTSRNQLKTRLQRLVDADKENLKRHFKAFPKNNKKVWPDKTKTMKWTFYPIFYILIGSSHCALP